MSETYEVLGILALLVCGGIGIVLAALQMPGTWVLVGGALLYDWWHHWDSMGPTVLGVMGGLAVLGEVIEFAAAGIFAGRAGGSRRASWGGIIGGTAGMFLLSFPVPVIGTIAGGLVGCFAGAVIGEWTVHDNLDQSTRVGFGAVVGRIAGMLAKLMISFVITGLSLCWAIRAAWVS